jgi:hypothetical protein
MTTEPRGWPRRTSGGTLAATALLVLTAVLVLSACGSPRASTPTGQQRPPSVSAPALHPPLAIDASYRAAVTQALATSLKLGDAQIRTELGADPNATLMGLAKPLGLAQDQLATTIRSALTAATAQKVHSSTWTPTQAAQLTSFWTAQTDPSVITQVSQWFHT